MKKSMYLSKNVWIKKKTKKLLDFFSSSAYNWTSSPNILPEYNPFSSPCAHIWIWRQQQSFSVSETRVRLCEQLIVWHFVQMAEGLKSARTPHAVRVGLVNVGVWNQSVQARSSLPWSISPAVSASSADTAMDHLCIHLSHQGSYSQTISGTVWGRFL